MTTPDGPVNVLVGVLSVFVCHVLATAIMFAISFIGPQFSGSNELGWIMLYAFFGIGITQLLYVIPLALWLRSRGRFDTMKGVIVGAAITLLLNGGCFIIVTNGGSLLL